MISPSNSFVGLTRAGPGVDPSLPAALYPTGRRNYLRVYPTDDLQGAALALLARDRGHRRVYVLDDGDPGYGALMATGVRDRRAPARPRGRRSRDRGTRGRDGYAALARRIARSGRRRCSSAASSTRTPRRVVRDLRARLGPAVDLLAPDGLTPLALLVQQAGEGASGRTSASPVRSRNVFRRRAPVRRALRQDAAGGRGRAVARSTPRRRPRCCSTRSRARTAPAAPSSSSSSARVRTASWARSASTRTATRPSPRSRSCASPGAARRTRSRASKAAWSSGSVRPSPRLVAPES